MRSTNVLHAAQPGHRLHTAIRRVLFGAAGLSLCAGVFPEGAIAQEPLEEILVTARFREENLQQTPLAITAITGDLLNSRSATSTLDLDAFVPNAVIAPLGAGWGSTAAAFIRGIGLGDNSLSFEPGVPIYIDDVYHGRPQGAVLDLLDVERVEVLRGPQGTLFGKNTLGGAVRIISTKPQGEGGYVDIGGGSRDRLSVRGSHDFALVEDKVFVRLAASSKTQDGYFDILDYECVNGAGSLGLGGAGITAGVFTPATELSTALTTHPAIGGVALGSVLGKTDDRGCVIDQLGGENVQSGRVALRFLASDTVEVNVITDLTYMDQEGPSDKYAVQLRTTDGVPAGVAGSVASWNTNVAVPVFGGPVPGIPNSGGQFDGRFQTPNDSYTSYHRFGLDPLTGRFTPNVQELTHWGLQTTVDWDLTDRLSFKSTTSYREFDNSFGRDSDGTPFPQTVTWDTSKHEQFTQELTLNGTTQGGNVDWTTGVYYYDAYDSNQGYNNGYAYTSSFTDHKDEQDLNNYAVFSHFDWQLTEKLAVSGGLRYTDDEKVSDIFRVTGNTAPPGVGLPQYVLIPHTIVVAESEEWSPKISVDYRWNENVMTYAALSTGFRGGGFGPRPANSLQVAAFATGVRRQLRDRRQNRFVRWAAAPERGHLLHGEHRQAAAHAGMRAVRSDPRRVVPYGEHGRIAQQRRRARGDVGADRQSAHPRLARLPGLLGHRSRHVGRPIHLCSGHRPGCRRSAATSCIRRARPSGTRVLASSTRSPWVTAARCSRRAWTGPGRTTSGSRRIPRRES